MTTVQGSRVSGEQHVGTRSTWALWGTAAGVCGVITNFVAQPVVSEEQRKTGVEVMDLLTRGPYHVAAVAGFAAVVCLLFFAAGFARWAQRQASESLPLRVVAPALVASAGALIASYGVKGQLSSYLEGGFNEGSYPLEDLYLYWMLDDLAGFFSWWGVAVALGCVAWISLRERLVVRWVGVLAALAALVPVGFLLAFGFTGFAGVITPVALIPVGVGMALRRE